jgi:glutaminyl-peptide cyclotransferase
MDRCLLPFLCALALASCREQGLSDPTPAGTQVAFDQSRAWKLLLEQVDIGPRPAGSEGAEANRRLIERELQAVGLKPVRESFEDLTPAGKIQFVNVYADLPGSGTDMVIMGSHYDTKRLPFRFVGANDAASNTAVLLEVARTLATGKQRGPTYRFLFIDGEEAVREQWIDPDNTYGSRFHARKLRDSGQAERVRAFVLLDMVGDADLRLTRDVYSDKRLLEIFHGTARKNGLGKYVDGPSMDVRDDHISFMQVGIPAVDLIDFSYGPGNSYWHTELDTPERCSEESLGVVGRIVMMGLEVLETGFGRR